MVKKLFDNIVSAMNHENINSINNEYSIENNCVINSKVTTELTKHLTTELTNLTTELSNKVTSEITHNMTTFYQIS